MKFIKQIIFLVVVVVLLGIGILTVYKPEKQNQTVSPVLPAFAASDTPRIYIDLKSGKVYSEKDIEIEDVIIQNPENDRVLDDMFDIDVKLNKDRNAEIVFNPKKGMMRPGRYKVSGRIKTPDGIRDFSQDFLWGVLAMNFNKAYYRPQEKAYIQMAVLDDRGDTICGADLNLKIQTPSGNTEILTTDDRVVKNPACGPNNVLKDPDYYTYYQFKETGIYKFFLSAETENGTWTIQDYVKVDSISPKFIIERKGPTRIWPYAEYEMKLTITASVDFQGQIIEQIPDGFTITKFDNLPGRVEEGKIIWEVSLNKNDQIDLSYTFDAPNIAPEFYLLGPVLMQENGNIIYQESRRWQIAGDAISYVQSISTNGGNLTSLSASFASNNTAGNLIIVVAGWAGTTITASVSDSNGNTYQTAVGPTTGVGSRGQMFYAENIAGGANTVTVAFSASVSGAHLLIHEYSGIATSNSLDQVTSATGSSTVCDTGSVTTTQADALLFASCGAETDPTTITAGTGYTLRELVGAAGKTATEDQIVSATGTYNATFTLGASAPWLASLATFKAASVNNPPSVVSVSDSPDPVLAGNSITFSVDWSDPDAGENVKVKICKTNSLTNQNCDGGFWATSTAFTTADPENISYVTQAGDVGTNNYYAFVCDDGGLCSTSSSGTFVVEGNNTPSVISVIDAPDPVDPGRTIVFAVDWSDPDAGENVKVKICKTNSLTNQNCDGGFWATSTAFTTSSPLLFKHDVPYSDQGKTLDYYVFVCDDNANCSASSAGTFTVNSARLTPNVKFR